MKFTRLRLLLEHIHSYENCVKILAETARFFNEPECLLFRLLNTVIASRIDNSDSFLGVSEENPSPVLEEISNAGIQGLAAIELHARDELQSAESRLSRLIDS